MEGFAKACSTAVGWYGLDLFSGSGMNWSLTTKREVRGSPLILLEAGPPGAAAVHICEQHDGARAALQRRVEPHAGRARIFAGDANEQVGAMLADIPVRA